MELKGTTALVTGASSGLGRAISVALADKGACVGLLARSEDKLAEVKGEIESSGGRAVALPADVTKPDEIADAVERLVRGVDGLDILVNNAGLGIFKPVAEMSIEEWDKHINVMLRGAFVVTHASLPHMFERERGHIVNISSLWAKRFCATCAAYTAAKFGVRGFSDSLREECRCHNVKVTNVMPGTVDTPFFDKSNWQADLSHALLPEDVGSVIVGLLEMPDRAVVEEVVLQAIQPDPCTD